MEVILVNKFNLKPSPLYDVYWAFAHERQNIFFKKLHSCLPPWTKDIVLSTYRFTNAYRASDRVSQYLIKNVIYQGDSSLPETFFRIILFKLFNKIETWEMLKEYLGEIKFSDYSFPVYNSLLDEAFNKGDRIYSAAYIMASGTSFFGYKRKHSNHLKLIELMMKDRLYDKIASAKTMELVFKKLMEYPCIGNFLAFQLTIDINYSDIINFDEMDFVSAGPGAEDGICKCFTKEREYTSEDLIKYVTNNQEIEFNKRGLQFQTLWGRPLQLIDCQNIFCEVSKYSRAAYPHIIGLSDRKRIKQKYFLIQKQHELWYPPKWGINEKVSKERQIHVC